ncbi:MAG: DUF3280 domain-containing protein [Hyphomicrobiaceae bacterium]|nr:DUF3280 domain-containing protein [Hyphomicrobiaceae bacterium]
MKAMTGRSLVAAGLISVGLMTGARAAAATETATAATEIAVIGLHFDNTSPEPTRPDEVERMKLVNAQLADRLAASPRYRIVPITPEIADKIADGPQVGNCTGCQLDYAKALGARLVAWGNVQKVSNLILNINVYIEDVETGQRTFVHSVDIRGNDDRSWTKGMAYLINNHLLADESRRSN